MMTVGTVAPQKTREMRIALMDSTVWNDFPFRDDDIFIATYAKAGTTWTQQIVAQLVLDGREDVDVHAVSPWFDSRAGNVPERRAMLEAQTHRRFIKTHLPADALRMHSKARYIYVARDGRDVVWSMHNHHAQLVDAFYEQINNNLLQGVKPFGRFDPDLDMLSYFRQWMDKGGYPWWPFWDHIRTWTALRDQPNVLIVHFNDLKRDLRGEIQRIALFLDVPLTAVTLDLVTQHCSFEYMKQHAERFTPAGGTRLKGGARSFINKGTNGRWRDVLTPDDIRRYEAMAESELGQDVAAWLRDGGAIASMARSA